MREELSALRAAQAQAQPRTTFEVVDCRTTRETAHAGRPAIEGFLFLEDPLP